MKSKDQKTSFLVNLSENIQCLKINHPKFFSESSCDIYLQVLKKRNLIQPGESREQKLGEFQQRTSELKFDMDVETEIWLDSIYLFIN